MELHFKHEFYNVVNDPKNLDIQLDVLGKEVKKYLKKGYIFNQEKNELIIPSKLTESPFKKRLYNYDLKIVHDTDPMIQMKLLAKLEKILLQDALNKHNGITFNISIEIEFTKKKYGIDIYGTFTFCREIMHMQ